MSLQSLSTGSTEGNVAVAAMAVQRELWISFASLLRSYAAAVWQGFPGAHFAAQTQESGTLTLQLGSSRLEVSYRHDSGAGAWMRNGSERGTFTFTEDGRVSLEQAAPVEMDAAAEVLAGKLI